MNLIHRNTVIWWSFNSTDQVLLSSSNRWFVMCWSVRLTKLWQRWPWWQWWRWLPVLDYNVMLSVAKHNIMNDICIPKPDGIHFLKVVFREIQSFMGFGKFVPVENCTLWTTEYHDLKSTSPVNSFLMAGVWIVCNHSNQRSKYE